MSSNMTKTFGTNLTNDRSFSQTSAQLSQREKSQIIERLIAIMSENKRQIWQHHGLKDEYQKRYNTRLPDDWLTIIEEFGKDLIEIETLSLSNGTRILIQLPIRVVKKEPGVATTPPPPKTSQPLKVTPKSEGLKVEPLVDLKPKFENNNSVPKIPDNRCHLNGVNDQTKSAVIGSATSDSVNLIEFSNGAADDVIFGGIPIPPPILPLIKPRPVNEEDFFDVVVVLAATPSNFVVVPFKNATNDSDFYKLKKQMSIMYEKEENKIELPPQVIKKGLFMAAKAQNTWYRVEVMSVLSEDPFQMIGYLIDFGEHKTFSLENIQPLYNCFRALPMQAIRASLATVQPIGSDWDVVTCIEFRKMVENKPFVATVYGIKIVDSNTVINVSLCDTSGSEDLYVGSRLVQMDLAKPVVPVI